MQYVAGAEPRGWGLVRQRRAAEARAAYRQHRPRRRIAIPVLTIHALDPDTGDAPCGYRGAIPLATAWFDTPVTNRCPECVWRIGMST